MCAFKTNKIKGVYSPADPGGCEMLLSIAFIEGLYFNQILGIAKLGGGGRVY